MTVFDRPPTDAELQTLADPAGAPPYLTLVDDGTTLTARPRAWPAALYWASMSVPVVSWCVALVWKWGELFGSEDAASRGCAAVMSAGMLVVPAAGWFGFQWHNRHTIRADEFFSLDRVAGTLTLPRAGVSLRRGEVVQVVELHGWHRVRDADGSSADYLREVSVLAVGASGQLTRYAVVIAGHAKPVRLVATALSAAFGAPHRKFVESLLRGGRWRSECRSPQATKV